MIMALTIQLKFSQAFSIANSSGKSNLASNIKPYLKKSHLQLAVMLLQLPPPGERHRPVAVRTGSRQPPPGAHPSSEEELHH